jgi:hypothetical protein
MKSALSHLKRQFNPGLTFLGEVEQFWHGLAVRQASTLDPQFVKELVSQSLHSTAKRVMSIETVSTRTEDYLFSAVIDLLATCRRSVLQQVGNETDGIGRGSWSEDFGEGMRLDLRELVLHVLETINTSSFEPQLTRHPRSTNQVNSRWGSSS